MKAASAAPAAARRFDVDALREFAGEQVFARGEGYFRAGAVQLLALEADRVFATVSGTENYTVTLTGGGFKFKGSCSCPAFADRGFCKHIVAVALAVNAAVIDEEPGGFTSLSRLRAYLKAKSADALAEMILDMAERDPVLFRKLDMAAAAAQESGKALETRLKKRSMRQRARTALSHGGRRRTGRQAWRTHWTPSAALLPTAAPASP